MLWALSSASLVYAILIGILILSWLVFSTVLHATTITKPEVLNNVKSTTFTVLLCLILSAFWIVPYILSFASPETVYSGIKITDDSIDLFSRNSNVLNVVRVMGYWFREVNYWPYSQVLYLHWLLASFILPLFAFSSLLLNYNNKYVLYFSIMGLFFIFMAKGTQNPASSAYGWLIFNVPFFEVFRDPNKWEGPLILVFCFLISFTIQKILQTGLKKSHMNWKKSTLVLFIFALSFILFIAPSVNGWFGDKYVPLKMPEEYYMVNNWLANQNGDFKVSWLPPYNGRGTTWGSPITGPFEILSSNRPTIGNIHPMTPFTAHYYEYIYSESLLTNKTVYFGKYLSILGSRYILFHDDIVRAEEEAKIAIANLKSQKDLEFVKKDGFIYIFKNKNNNSQVFIPSQNFIVGGDLNIATSLNVIDAFDPSSSGLLYTDQVKVKNYPEVDGIIFNSKNEINDIAFAQIDDQYFIAPSTYTNRFSPTEVWSTTGLNDDWIAYFRFKSLTNPWEFDYNKGIAISDVSGSSSPHTLVIPVNIQKSDTYELYARVLENPDGGKLTVSFDGESFDIVTVDKASNFVWKKIGTFNLSGGEHSMVLVNNNGFNAVNVFALMPQEMAERYFDNAWNFVKGKKIIYFLEGESDFDSGIVSDRFGGEASQGRVVILQEKATTSINILRNSSYKVAIRAFVCPDNNPLILEISDKKFEVNLTDKEGKLKWIYLDPIFLQKGQHSLQILPEGETIIDSLVVYSTTNSDETINDVFKHPRSATILSYKEIDPTKYVIHVNSQEPFMLAFTEAYDPLWRAYVNDEEIKPLPLYSIINGFWINKTGEYDVEIAYKPQEFFYIGATISSVAIIVCIGFLIFNWRKTFRRR